MRGREIPPVSSFTSWTRRSEHRTLHRGAAGSSASGRGPCSQSWRCTLARAARPCIEATMRPHMGFNHGRPVALSQRGGRRSDRGDGFTFSPLGHGACAFMTTSETACMSAADLRGQTRPSGSCRHPRPPWDRSGSHDWLRRCVSMGAAPPTPPPARPSGAGLGGSVEAVPRSTPTRGSGQWARPKI